MLIRSSSGVPRARILRCLFARAFGVPQRPRIGGGRHWSAAACAAHALVGHLDHSAAWHELRRARGLAAATGLERADGKVSIEDYGHSALKVPAIVTVRLMCFALCVTGLAATLRVMLTT
jgi:hypothetical protein